MSMKQMLAAKFTANIGAADGVLETGTVGSCNGDNVTVGLSAGASAASFISGFPKGYLGRLGGGISSIYTAINVGRSGKLTASDLFTILAGVAGFASTFPAFAGMGVAAAVFTVSGMAVTLYDNMNHKDSSGCTNPPGIPLGGIVPPGGKVPDTGDAAAASCPLIIDMDGNGVKTISINKNVFFDLDNNFFAENVGWVEKGDAFLVWDRDNNGVIDSGNELFGNHTLLRNGKKADNGFAALKELDDNNDQIFDEKDKAWFQLQLWSDHNQNGVSDEGELVKLSESGIKSIDLAYKNNNSTDENGNEHRQQSHVTWNDGRTSGITDVWFNTNTARSYYKEEVQISDDIKAMPNIIAFGNLLDLHAAMAKSPTLKYVIKEYMDANLAERDTLLNDLIYEWTGTSGVDPNSRGSSIDARKLAVLELITGRTFRQGSSLNPNSNAAKLLEAEFKKFADYTLAQLESKTVYKDIFTMNSFLINSETGELEFDWENLNSAITHFIKTRNFIEAKRVISIAKNLGIYNDEYLAVIDKNFANLAESDKTIAYFIKRNFVEGGIDDIKLVGTEDHDLILANSQDNILEAGNGDDTLIGGMGNDTLKGGFGADTYIFSKGHGQDVIYEYSDSANSKKDIDTLKFTDVNYAEVKFRRVDNDLMLFGYHDTDSVTVKSFYSHVDYQFDKLEFADRSITRDELIKAGLHLYGTDGNDDIKDHADWDSILEGGKGNDILRGGYGADTYIFSKGHGQDIVYEDTNNDNRARDIDTLKFTDVNYAEVKFRRVDNDLMLFGYHDTDSVTIKSFYNHVDYQFDKLDFADRSITRDELGKQGMALFGTDGDDNINDWGRNSVIDAGAGNDTVNGGNGDDTLIGGKGNDILRGGYGADTYIFSKGHGQDIVYEDTNNDNRARDIDTLKFTDVNYAEVKFRRVDNDLMLFGYHDTDSVTVKSFYSHVDYQFDKLEFADRSITRDELIKAGLHLYGTDGNDDIKDHADWDSILEGGKGNDILRGGYGADTYIFSKGHGQDIVYEDTNNDNRARDIDTLKFTDVNYAEVKFRRVDNDLMLFGYHDTDSVTIKSFYNHVDYQFDKLDFADRSITRDELGKQGMALFGTDGDDNINDWGRNSVIDAGAGNDTVNGGNGDDTLIGGKGNDILRGGYGADTYIFSKGHGQDIVYEDTNNDNRARDIDTLKFTDVNYAEVKFRRVDNDLMLFGYHDTDSVTIKSFYNHVDYQFDKLDFADRSITRDELGKQGMALFGTDGDDNINDWGRNSVIDAGAGNDTVNGGNGDDTLIGGKGNDILRGGYGADTYIFSKGHGQDIVYEDTNNDNRARDIDTLKFTDINLSELWFSRENNDLIIKSLLSEDKVTVQNWYSHQDHKIENIRLSNEQTLVSTQVEKMVESMAGFAQKHGGEISLVSPEEVKQYINSLTAAL